MDRTAIGVFKNAALAAFITVWLTACGGGGGGGSGSGSSTGAADPSAQNSPAVVMPASIAGPRISSVSTAVVAMGERFTLTGEQLDRVSQFRVGSTVLERQAGSSASQVVLVAPAERLSGPISLVGESGAAVPSIFNLTVYEPVTVETRSVEPTYGGRAVVLRGRALETVRSVKIQEAPAIFRFDSQSLEVTVPNGLPAGEHWIELSTAHQQVRALMVQVLPTVTAGSFSATSDGQHTTLRITGDQLRRVSGVQVGDTPATVTGQLDNVILARVPAGTTGVINLDAGAQGRVQAGMLSGDAIAVLSLSRLQIGQVFSFNDNDPAIRLTPGKPSGLRIALTASRPDVPVDSVNLSVVLKDGRITPIRMAGPRTLPTAVSFTETAQHFSAILPGHAIQEGMRIVVTAEAQGAVIRQEFTPGVGQPTNLKLVLVPIEVAGVKPRMVDTDKLKVLLSQLMPYAHEDMEVSISASPLVLTDRNALTTLEGMSQVLGQIESRRRNDDPGAFYFGMFPAHVPELPRAFSLGIGYVVTPIPNAAKSAIGIDLSTVSQTTALQTRVPFVHNQGTYMNLIHELGHNHGLSHAPCGGAVIDPVYGFPHANGSLGTAAIHGFAVPFQIAGSTTAAPLPENNSEAGVWYQPKDSDRDVMGYCAGNYFSSWHFDRLRAFAEENRAQVTLTRTAASVASGEGVRRAAALMVSGLITPRGVTFHAPTPARGAPDPLPSKSAWTLEIRTRSGQTLSLPIEVQSLSVHEAGHHAFHLKIQDVGEIESLSLRHHGKAVPVAK